MSSDSPHQTEDTITVKIRRWERVLSDHSVWDVAHGFTNYKYAARGILVTRI